MDTEIACFWFGRNISTRVMYKLRNTHSSYQVFSNNLDHYLWLLLHWQPNHILGLGMYSWRDQDALRIETHCSNQFRNEYMHSQKKEAITLQPFLTPDNSLWKFANGMGNSLCNKTSYEIMQLIRTWELHSQYTFIHIPMSFSCSVAAREIDTALRHITHET